jgi:hypothetical protein
MPGFLDDTGYSGTTRIPLGGQYWCEVKNCLDAEEKGFVDDLLGGKQQVDVAGQRRFATMDYTSSRREMVVHSLVAWNLTDKDGSPWLLLPESRPAGKPYPAGSVRRISVSRLPGPVFDQIFEVCDELNSPRKGADAVTFPDGPVGGDPDGDGGAAGPAAVPDGTGVLDPAGADQG